MTTTSANGTFISSHKADATAPPRIGDVVQTWGKIKALAAGTNYAAFSQTDLSQVWATRRTSTTIPESESELARQQALSAVDLRPARPEPEVFTIDGMKKWEGRVVDVEGDVFSAELVPQDDHEAAVVADFPVSLLNPENDVEPGDFVYVTARTVERQAHPPARTVQVRLRRLGNWTKEEGEGVSARAKEAWDRFAPFVE